MEGGKLCKFGSWHPHEIMVVLLKTKMLSKFCCFDAFCHISNDLTQVDFCWFRLEV